MFGSGSSDLLLPDHAKSLLLGSILFFVPDQKKVLRRRKRVTMEVFSRNKCQLSSCVNESYMTSKSSRSVIAAFKLFIHSVSEMRFLKIDNFIMNCRLYDI